MRWYVLSLGLGMILLLGACERSYWDPTIKVGDSQGHLVDRGRGGQRGAGAGAGAQGAGGFEFGSVGDDMPKAVDSVQRGSGTFVRRVTAPSVDTAPGDITLNFDNTDIREVVKVILGDLLGVNYILDPQVQGFATLETGRALRREHLIPTLETLLRMNSAAIVYRAGTYEVVPLSNAVQGKVVPQLGESTRPLPSGYSVRVVPLQYIGAEEMNSILQPLAPEGSVIRVDTLRNLILLAGTSPEMGNLIDTIRVFDVDWMEGLSVGFFVLEYAKANEMVTQLQGLLADDAGNPFTGLFRFIPVESANAMLVVSPQERYIQQARNWIERLDMAEATGSAAERLYVYRVKHGDAENLADVLSQLFGGEGGGGGRRGSVGGVAPGLGSADIGSRAVRAVNQVSGTDTTGGRGGGGLGGGLGGRGGGMGGGGVGGGSSAPRSASSRTVELSSEVSIVADAVNNSLLVRASPKDYKKILDALKQLDIIPLQVLVEATILEITLAGNLEYGVQWNFFGLATKDHRSNISLDGTLDSASESGIGPIFPGFNWTVIARPDQIRAVLSALAGENLVNVLSSPSVMVMDNQTARIQVGQQVPVATTQQQGLQTTDRVINQIEYKDTGVMLSVKPRVTPGGMVQMEIEQEVSTVASTDSSALNSPTFQTRNITSSVAVRSSQAVVLGGLIQDQRSTGKQGVPGLYSLPIVGPLFGERRRQADRTELVVILTPKVISSDQDVEDVIEDFRTKLRGLDFKF